MLEALCAAIADEPELKVSMQVGNVTQALQIVMMIIPDIILLALDRSDDSEMEALTILHKSIPTVPILALTSNEAPGQERSALEHGAQAVLTKAAPRAELIRALRKLRVLRLKQLTNYPNVMEKGTKKKICNNINPFFAL
jgi:DNA-binding NarL/FixJ family response regulator